MKAHVRLGEYAKVGIGTGIFFGLLAWFFATIGFSLIGSPIVGLIGGAAAGLVMFFAVAIGQVIYLVAGAWISSKTGFWKQSRFWKIFQAYFISVVLLGVVSAFLRKDIGTFQIIWLLLGAVISSAITGLIGRFMADRMRLVI